jgi:hypothetical protein
MFNKNNLSPMPKKVKIMKSHFQVKSNKYKNRVQHKMQSIVLIIRYFSFRAQRRWRIRIRRKKDEDEEDGKESKFLIFTKFSFVHFLMLCKFINSKIIE